MESYKWLYNILIFSLYYLCLSSLHNLTIEEENTKNDLVTDLRVRERVYFSRLDPSIRHHMRKSGISLVKNTYVGFDTEFNNHDIKTNSLVSTQLAITTKLYAKLPKVLRYSISKVDVEQNKLHRVKTKSTNFNY
jgi:hypothetical protein